ncbi:hypothetical protein B0H13DRAFT_1877263 [Mycena leptocephala]|nr:hypothetical protein B0H13DRAFT_1877263 [Mycena leptocephala]
MALRAPLVPLTCACTCWQVASDISYPGFRTPLIFITSPEWLLVLFLHIFARSKVVPAGEKVVNGGKLVTTCDEGPPAASRLLYLYQPYIPDMEAAARPRIIQAFGSSNSCFQAAKRLWVIAESFLVHFKDNFHLPYPNIATDRLQ